MTMAAISTRPRPNAAFTLVEVILAIFIALGILVVLLYFYQQATSLRTQILQQTEQMAAARLIMDRITGELRAAQPASGVGPGFVGASNAIQFVKADVPSFSAWTGGTLGRSAFPVSDLKLIRYRLEILDVTNVAGLLRTEEPLVDKNQAPLSDQVDVVVEQTNSVNQAASTPVLEEIRFLQFRYWSGTNWLNSWLGAGMPTGIEVSLGAEAQTSETESPENPSEVFRRVIYLVGSSANQKASTGSLGAGGGSGIGEEAP